MNRLWLYSDSHMLYTWRRRLGLLLVLLVIGASPVQASENLTGNLAADFPWSQGNSDGFGSQFNESIYSMAVFQNRLYAGASNPSTGAQLWRSPEGQTWSQVSAGWQSDPHNTYLLSMHDQVDEILTFGTYNENTGGEIWQYDGYATWTQLNSDGFGDANNIGLWTISQDFYNQFFVGTYNLVSGAEVHYYQSGAWSQINSDGFGDANNQVATSMLVLEDYDLLVGTLNVITGAEVWRWNGSSWGQVNSNGFGDADNQAALSIGVFNDQQYVGTYNVNGAEIWRYNEVSSGWQNVAAGGFGDPDNTGVWILYPFGGYLYAGTENANSGAQVWRTANGSDWEPVMFAGFSNANNLAILSLQGFGHRLFAGTNNSTSGTEIWHSEPLGSDPSFQISSVPVDAVYPDGAFNPFWGQYLVVWQNYNPGSEDISAQRLTSEGQLVNPSFFVSTGMGAQRTWPQIAFDTDLQRFLVVWQQYEAGTISLRSQLVTASGTKLGDVNLLKSISSSDAGLMLQQLVYSPVSDDFVVLYTIHDDSYSEGGVNAMTLNPNGQLAVDNIVVRPMTLDSYIFSASLDWNHAHNECLVTWSEMEGVELDVFGRIVELATPDVLDAAFKISTNRDDFEDNFPNVAAMGGQPTGKGTYLVTWTSFDALSPTYDMNYTIYGRKLDGDGNFLGSTFPISVQPAHQSCSISAANEGAGLFFTGYSTDYDDYSDFPFIHGRFLPNYGGSVSAETWLGNRYKSFGCALPVSGGIGEFLVLSSSLAPGESHAQIHGSPVSYRRVYLPFVRR